MQGDPLVMNNYVIGLFPRIKNLNQEIPDVTDTCYTGNARALGTFARIGTYFNFLTRQGLGRRYYPEQSKSIRIVHPDNIEVGKFFGASWI